MLILESEKHILAVQKEQLEKTRKRLRTLMGLLLVAAVAFLVAGYFWWDANQQKDIAKEKEQEAKAQSEIANQKTEIAEEEKRKSLALLEEIKKQKGLTDNALNEASKALDAKNQKEVERLKAESERIKAENKNIASKMDEIKTLIKINDIAGAKKLLNEALSISPNQPELLKLQKELQ
jgi:Flp pilus assembly protein TadD